MKNDDLYNTLELGCNFLLVLEISKVTDTKSKPVQDMIVNLQFIFFGIRTRLQFPVSFGDFKSNRHQKQACSGYDSKFAVYFFW